MRPPVPPVYTGRFAPSPTGPLHAGSLIAALASYLDARAAGGRWLLRVEDLDPPRESPQAARAILQALETLGLHWDGEVLYQSTRHEAYREALEDLRARGLAFACDCSRQDVQDAGGVYPGTCRERQDPPAGPHAMRCRVPEPGDPAGLIVFDDRFQGRQDFDLGRDIGDFVIRRKDGLYAYQLAVVVDDAWQGVNQVIRGIDLLDSTPRQIHLQRLLRLPTPAYGHFPVIVNALGQKLSKQHFAAALELREPRRTLLRALRQLRQSPDPSLADGSCEDILRWAVEHWKPGVLQGVKQIPEFVPLD